MNAANDVIANDVIKFFQYAVTIVFALALGEAFKQFVADRADRPEVRVILWDKLPALLSFLLLILPFMQGSSRYFFVAYGQLTALPKPYSSFLIVDGAALMFEASLFFIMSRALSPAHWRAYYIAVLTLLAADSLWGLTILLHLSGNPAKYWIVLNIFFAVVVSGILYKFRGEERSDAASRLGLIAVSIRTILDYYVLWDFYFPKT